MLTLTKDKNKDFVILNLTDPQLSTDDWGNTRGDIAIETITELIKRVSPDLITISGDIAYGTHYESYKHFANFMDSFEIPWSIVFGNHDNQEGAEAVEKAVSILSESKCFLFESGPKELGNGNYFISIEEDGKPVETIFMMDTHDREFEINEKGENIEYWGKLYPSQIEWYGQNALAELNRGSKDSILITHIPIYAYNTAFDAAFSGICEPSEVPLLESGDDKYWNEGYFGSFGVKREGICSYPGDEGMFKAIKKIGTTKTIVAGHDHINNTVITYDGVKFVYALKTGAGCYWNEDLNGGTVIVIDRNGVKTVRHEYVNSYIKK